jgi:chromate transporter
VRLRACLVGFLLLTVWKAPSWIVVVLFAAAATALGLR